VLAFEDPTPAAPGFLVTTFLEPERRAADFEEALGRGLAELNAATRDAFGFEIDTYCGTTTQPNPDTGRWVDFYRTHRLAHQLRLSRRRYDRGAVRTFEALFVQLDDLLGDDEPPALIHGDLWSGNLHADGPRPALIDPAVAYAHREAEIGMMTLFGGFSARVFAAYEEVRPLRPGWRERNPLYELYHVMNHATLFGGGYVSQAVGIAQRFA
jgi:fructosamine-3-kinase